MEIFLLFLLLGLAGLLAANLYLFARVTRLERQIGAIRPGPALPGEPGPEAGAEGGSGLPPPRETLASLFEQLVGGRLLIWIGGIALVVAGFFLIRHTIEIGLVTPELRMAAAGLFGLTLLAGGEYARSRRSLADEPRVAQALVGAGIAVLYATAYGSWYLYGQIGGRTASALMLLISAAALGLSLRHGPATAVMGMVGGFLTPWLAGDPEGGALPILAYIALLNAAIFILAWKRGWGWLAAGSVALSFVWTMLPDLRLPAGRAGRRPVRRRARSGRLASALGGGAYAGADAAARHRPRRAGVAGDPARHRPPRLAALRVARGDRPLARRPALRGPLRAAGRAGARLASATGQGADRRRPDGSVDRPGDNPDVRRSVDPACRPATGRFGS